MKNPAFETAYRQLNEAQRKAVDAIEGPVVVIAGPGTGKTTVLTLRIANILRQTDTAPESILALTFTDSGSYAVRKKLVEIIGPTAYKISIHTFHGFAAQVIESYPDFFEKIIGSRIITESEQIAIIKKALSQSKIELLRPYGDPNYYVSPILRELQILKRESIKPEQFRASLKVNKIPADAKASEKERLEKQRNKNLELAQIYEEYEKALSKNKLYDFDDMLLDLIQAMNDNPDFKLMLQENFQYILADEHQDANMSQNRILELLSDFHSSPNLFIVGDDKQAIYRFQGASLENFLFFKKKYPEALIVNLEHNYRSHQGILDAAHSLISKNPSPYGEGHTHLISLQIGSFPLVVTETETVNKELAMIGKTIKKIIENGDKPEEIAVIYRDNKHAQPISRVLQAHGIPHRIESDSNLLREPEVIKLIMLLRAIDDFKNIEHIAKVLLFDEFKLDVASVLNLFDEFRRSKTPFQSSLVKNDKIKKVYKQIETWSREALYFPVTHLLQKIISDMKVVEMLMTQPNSIQKLNHIQNFFDHVENQAKSKKQYFLRDFLEYLDIAEEHGLRMNKKSPSLGNEVKLMTAHRAKGLEFRHVFIVHCIDGVWGNRSDRKLFTIPIIEHARNVGRIEDERRLFYVAITRAREAVYISYARSNGEKETLPSQFLSEIDSKYQIEGGMQDPEGEDRLSEFQVLIPAKRHIGSSILDREFLAKKYLSQPLSVTHINNFLECPWKYFFVNLVRIPEIKNKHQMYGSAVHALLRRYFESNKAGDIWTLQQINAIFESELSKYPMTETDFIESLRKGKKSLSGYFKFWKNSWPRNVLTEYKIRTSLDVGEFTIELTGILDKIEILNGRNINVVDYKTAKPKSRNEIIGKVGSNGEYFRQLVFYRLLLEKSGDKFLMQEGQIDFIEPNPRNLYKRESFIVEQSHVSGLMTEIKNMSKKVMDGSFIEEGCGESKCEYCRLGNLLRESSASDFVESSIGRTK